MAILGYVYFPDIAGTNTQLGQITSPAILADPPVSPVMKSNSTSYVSNFGENWYKKASFDNDGANKSYIYTSDVNNIVAGVFEYPVNSTELWVRFIDLDWNPSNTSGYWDYSNTYYFLEFFNISNGVKKLVGRLVADERSGNLYYRVFGADAVTVVKEHLVGTVALFRSNSSTKELIVDFRFSFDKIAGFIQQYDYKATRVGEVLGQTVNDLPITHVVVYSSCIVPTSNSYRTTLSRIVANEPTFGMYVMPFYAKAEGTDQGHFSGDYSRFSMGRYSFANAIGVGLEKPGDGKPVRYSFVPKTLTEQGLPANYNVLSIQVNTVVDSTSATADPIAFSTYLKQISTGTRFEIPQQTVKNNVDYVIAKSPQVRVARWDKNPVTGQNWQPGDLASFEIGFKI